MRNDRADAVWNDWFASRLYFLTNWVKEPRKDARTIARHEMMLLRGQKPKRTRGQRELERRIKEEIPAMLEIFRGPARDEFGKWKRAKQGDRAQGRRSRRSIARS